MGSNSIRSLHTLKGKLVYRIIGKLNGLNISCPIRNIGRIGLRQQTLQRCYGFSKWKNNDFSIDHKKTFSTSRDETDNGRLLGALNNPHNSSVEPALNVSTPLNANVVTYHRHEVNFIFLTSHIFRRYHR